MSASSKSLVNFILHSNLFVMAVVTSLLLYTYVSAGIPIYWHYLFFVAGGTLGMYSFHRLVGALLFVQPPKPPRFLWVEKHSWSVVLILGIACAMLVYSLSQLIFTAFLWYSLPALALSVAYIVPLRMAGKKFRLRDIPFVKVFVIGATVTWLVYILPLHLAQFSVDQYKAIWVFVFVIALTLPFDMRDKEVDAKAGLKTFATVLGFRFTQTLVVVLLLACSAWSCFHDFGFQELFMAPLLSMPFIFMLHPKSSELYFSFAIEGCLALPLLLHLYFNA